MQGHTENGRRLNLLPRKGGIMMEHAGSYVTWDQLIQLGILLLAAGNLLYIIFHNHFDKKK